MSEAPALGVVFPVEGDGRSTSATGRAVIADALEVVDTVGARAARDEANWRTGYPLHFRRPVSYTHLDVYKRQELTTGIALKPSLSATIS